FLPGAHKISPAVPSNDNYRILPSQQSTAMT
ncbi:MAG: hypothetical protein ACI8XC_003763, partial [Gammaproteobacteria bacterium]